MSVAPPMLLRRPRAPKQLQQHAADSVAVTKIPRSKTDIKRIVTDNISSDASVTYDGSVDGDFRPYGLHQAPNRKTGQKRPVVVETDKLPAHHTSLQEVSTLTDSRSLVKPIRPRGPDPLPARQPRKQPTVFHVPLDEDLQHYYRTPEFTLDDFLVQLSADEDVPLESVQHAVYSRYTYDRLQAILLERCVPSAPSLATLDLRLPDRVSLGPRRIPQRQLICEMALVIKEQLSRESGVDMKSSVRAPVRSSQNAGMRQCSCAEIIFYQDHSTEYQTQLSDLLQMTEAPGTGSIVHGPTSRYFNGSRRCGSPFGGLDDCPVSSAELSVLDSLLSGGRALSLKAQFLSQLPDVQLLLDTVEYVNLSFNNFQTVPSDLFDMPSLTVLLMRNNPLAEISAEICRLCNLTTCVLSFALLTALPTELFSLSQLEHLDVSYNLLTYIPTEIQNLTKLVEFNVEGNQLIALPVSMIRLHNLLRIRVSNNFMHPLFWKDAIQDQPQHLIDLSCRAARHLSSNDDTVSRLSADVEDVLMSPLSCHTCSEPRYGCGFCSIRPVQKIFGVRNVPFLFHSCTQECRLAFLSRRDGLAQLLYGSSAAVTS